jgi:hypothetical protein
MPLPLPRLDDYRYEELVAEAIARIPMLAPEWTDHNPSEAGITLIELLAWLTELVLYRVDQIPDANYQTFLRLLNNSQDVSEDLEVAVRDTIKQLREPYRAVTARDYEELAIHTWKRDGTQIARAHCLPRRNLEAPNPQERFADAPGHVSLVVVPQSSSPTPRAAPEILADLYEFFKERRTLTTRHHVVNPDYVSFSIEANVEYYESALPRNVQNRVATQLKAFFSPLTGGEDGKGWAFGRHVFLGEIFQLIDHAEGIDYVKEVRIIPNLSQDQTRFIVHPQYNAMIGFNLNPMELPNLKTVTLRTGN